MKLAEVATTQTIFESLGRGDIYFETWQREIHPILVEVAVNPDQIQQLFKSIEAGSRTSLGRGIDVIKGVTSKISDAWFNKFGDMLQNSAPVQSFDAKWETLKQDIAQAHPDMAAKLAKYGEFAKNNPNLHKFLLAIGGSLAAALGIAVAGGVGAGAVAVGTGAGVATGILNIADRLLQGQKASTAIGRGVTTGALAGLTAGAAAKIGEMIRAGITSNVIANLSGKQIVNNIMTYNGVMFFSVTKEPETSMLSQAFNAMDPDNPSTIDTFVKLIDKVNSPEYQKQISAAREAAIAAKEAAKSAVGVVRDLTKFVTAAAGGAVSAATNRQPQESIDYKQITKIFESIETQIHNRRLQEKFHDLMEADKPPGRLSSFAKKFTTKITADQLEKAWIDAGSPTDSEELAKLLSNMGVGKDLIDKTYADLMLPVPAADQAGPTVGTAPAASTAPAAPTGGASTATTPAAGAPSGPTIFDDPAKLLSSFEAYIQAGGKFVPGFRGELKQILLTALRTVESRQRKINKIVKEAKEIENQLKTLKNQKNTI